MTSNWNIIPLTVIGPEKNIKSAGVVFSCNTSEDRFLWILKLILYELPSQNVTTTICSDNNPGLNTAFQEMRLLHKNVSKLIWTQILKMT